MGENTLSHETKELSVRTQARRTALEAAFMCDFHGLWDEELVRQCQAHFPASAKARPYAWVLIRGIIHNRSSIDRWLGKASSHWRLDHMNTVDRSILRLAGFELLMVPSVPRRVAINEAVELAKAYGLDESYQFVNGVLDKLSMMMEFEKTRAICGVSPSESGTYREESSLPEMVSCEPTQVDNHVSVVRLVA